MIDRARRLHDPNLFGDRNILKLLIPGGRFSNAASNDTRSQIVIVRLA
jgi:hypothetical protein